ncbi:MAG: ATP-binding protein [Haloferacaceae archaeon]
MSDSEQSQTITVANVSEGPGGDGTAPGAAVSLPIVELLTGRGFVTGKSGSGKSNSASVVAEKLLDEGFGLLIVDVEGEYYGLKEEYELLHAGADEECDIQVDPEHAEKLASLALEQNVPIILDVSGYLDEDVADELVFETARQLFAKEKKLKQPFLMLVEEVHEYIPEGGGMTDAGRMLVKVGKRGRKHGLGIVGISQRPANVKKDFITQCDWLVWHRLTWDNDTKVVRRIIDKEHAGAVEDLDDGEAFLMTDWSEAVRRVQFHRKSTFDAGATPGLEDFERPDLKSVSGDLVDELREISEKQERRESELADLRQEIERKERKIAELEEELEQARDLERMADRFSQALLRRADAPYRDGDVADGEVDAPDDGTEPTASSGEADATTEPPEPFPNPMSAPDRDRTAADADADPDAGAGGPTGPDDAEVAAAVEESEGEDRLSLGTRDALVAEVAGRVEELDPTTTGMLRHFRAEGPAAPVDAHVAAGGNADRELAYSRLRSLRHADLVEHTGRGRYDYAVPALVRAEYDDKLHDDDLVDVVRAVEETFVDDPTPGWGVRDDGSASPPEGGPDASAAGTDAEAVDDGRTPDDDAEIVADADPEPAGPAFREDDAEYVDHAEFVDDATDEPTDEPTDGVTMVADGTEGPGPSDARDVMPEDGRDAVVVEGTTGETNGSAEGDTDTYDAEFID